MSQKKFNFYCHTYYVLEYSTPKNPFNLHICNLGTAAGYFNLLHAPCLTLLYFYEG